MAKMQSCTKNDTIKKLLYKNLAKGVKEAHKKEILVIRIPLYDTVQQFLQNKKKNCQKTWQF